MMTVLFWIGIFLLFPVIINLFVTVCVIMCSLGILALMVIGSIFDTATRWRY